MGRFLSTPSAGNTAFLVAGSAIANEDLLEIGSDGKAYPVSDPTGAVIANKNTNIFAQTSIANGYYSGNSGRNPVTRDAQGNLYVVANNSSASDIVVRKYSPAGGLLVSVSATTLGTVNYSVYCATIKILSNGNILVVWSNSQSGQKLVFAILSPAMVVLKTATLIGNGPYGLVFGCTTLASGGFAVTYDDYSNNTLLRLATFDNAGTAVLAPTTIQTKAGAGCYSWVIQLSNGDLAIAYSQASSQTYGVFTTAGVQVSAFTNLSTYPGLAWIELSTINGTFCIVGSDNGGSNLLYRVCSNAGTVLGTQTLQAVSGVSDPKYKLTNDGQNYYGIHSNSGNSWLVLVKIPVTGASNTVMNLSSTGYNFGVDFIIISGNVVWVAGDNGGGTVYYGVNSLNGVQVTSAAQLGNNGDTWIASIIDSGSSTFTAYWNYVGGNVSYIIRKKALNTALLGVADFAAPAGQTVGVYYQVGAYRINGLPISSPLTFDHSSAVIPGNRGTLLPVSAILKGL